MLTKRPWIYPCSLAIALLLAGYGHAQKRAPRPDNQEARPADTTQKRSDSSKKAPPAIRPYKDVITAGMKTYKGFFTVHQKDDKYYFEIPNSLLDRDILYFERKQFKDRAGMAGQINDRSYIDYIHTFPANIEVHAVKTFNAGLNPAAPNYTVELNSSLVLLPEKPMTPRLQDKRVGYFTTQYRDFDADPQGVKQTVYIKKWRLEPRPEDMEKYKSGGLVEPAKPIVFYIDPVTPKKWVPYLMQGVNDLH